MAVEACSGAILCIIVCRQAADRVRIMLVAWLVGPDAAAYLCYDLAYNYHLAGGELIAGESVLLTMCPRGDLLWPGVAVFGLGCLFALVSYLTFYLFLWDLSSVYFLSTDISHKNGAVRRYFRPVYIYFPIVSLSGPDSTIMSIRHFLPEVINRHHPIIIIT